MNWYLEELLARERLDEARKLAAQRAMVRAIAPARHPVRLALGLALIRAGHWVAGRGPRRAGQPSRVTA
jgi:hypothetical protein